VADFRVAQVAEHKIKKQSDTDEITLQLVKNPDIVAWVAAQTDKPFVVGFAAETQNVLAYAKDKLQRKKLDMICANQVGENQGFECEDNSLTVMTHSQQQTFPSSPKYQQAIALLNVTSEKL
jgi:phosphopantothenoylcysteine decarboxylase/phosphopantothenate--cysteine ligase